MTHRRVVLAGWLVALVGLTVLSQSAGTAHKDSFGLKGTQSFEAQRLLERSAPTAAGDREQIVLAVDHGRVTDPAVRARAQAMLARIAALRDVASVSSPYAARGTGQISPSGQVAFADVTLTQLATRYSTGQAQQFVNTARASAGNGLQVQVEGQLADAANKTSVSTTGLGAFAALIVLLVVFGSLLAATLPLITAGVALGAGTATIGLLSHLIDMATFSSELSLLIGLGVGVDYALFIVTRYRKGLQRGKSAGFAVCDRATDLGGDLLVQRDRVGLIYLNREHAASYISVIMNLDQLHARLLAADRQRPHRRRPRHPQPHPRARARRQTAPRLTTPRERAPTPTPSAAQDFTPHRPGSSISPRREPCPAPAIEPCVARRVSRKSMPLCESDKRRLGGAAHGVGHHQPDAVRVLPDREPGRETQTWFAFHGQPPRPARTLTFHARDVTMLYVSRAPLERLQDYKRRMGWSFPWVSSAGSDFNFDLGVSRTEEQTREAIKPMIEGGTPPIVEQMANVTGTDVVGFLSEGPGFSAFVLDDRVVYHTYSTTARGLEFVMGYYPILDRAPKGRDEDDSQMWIRRHDEYCPAIILNEG